MTHFDPLLAQAVSAILLAWWKMLLIIIPFGFWGWLIATKLDKDARYFHLNGDMWNGIHLGAGVAALAAVLFIPIFWIGWPVQMMILLAPILAYWKVRNAAVPEENKYYLSSQSITRPHGRGATSQGGQAGAAAVRRQQGKGARCAGEGRSDVPSTHGGRGSHRSGGGGPLIARRGRRRPPAARRSRS